MRILSICETSDFKTEFQANEKRGVEFDAASDVQYSKADKGHLQSPFLPVGLPLGGPCMILLRDWSRTHYPF